MKRKSWFIVLIVFITILAISLIAAPTIVKKISIKNSKEWFGRQIDLGNLNVNFFTGTVKLIDFEMFEADDMSQFVSFDTLILNVVPYRFFKNELVIQQLYLKGLHTSVIQNDSVFNFDDLILFFESGEDTLLAADTSGSEPFRFELSNLELSDAYFEYVDQSIDKTVFIKDLSFFVPFIGWNQAEASEAGLRFNFKNEGFFQSSINIDPNRGDFDANIEVNTLNLEPFADYVKKYLSIDSLQGKLNSNLRLVGNIDHPELTQVSGLVNVQKFKSTNENGQTFMAVENLDCVLKNVNAGTMNFEIDTLRLTKPYVYFDMFDSTNNIFEVIRYDELFAEDTVDVAEAETQDSDTTFLSYALNHINIQNGSFDFVDNTTSETFTYHLSELALSTDSISNDADWVELTAAMLLNRRGKLAAQLGFNPNNPMDLNLEYVITDFLLSDLNIYSRQYMGVPILYGDMYYKAETEILDGQLKSENELIIHNVELGDKSGGLYSLPLKFALFLLKDKDGVINLDVPVRGDLNDPQINVGKIVWTTFKNLIVKVAASPVKFLSGLLKVDPKDIQEIKFDYLDTTLTAHRQKQLDLLVELEQKKEGLDIELVYFNDLSLEKEQIAIAEAGKLFNTKNRKDYREEEEMFLKYLRKASNNDTISMLDASLQLIDPATIDSLAQMFAAKRLEILPAYIQHVNDSSEIRMHISDPGAPKNVGSKPVFEVKYSMK